MKRTLASRTPPRDDDALYAQYLAEQDWDNPPPEDENLTPEEIEQIAALESIEPVNEIPIRRETQMTQRTQETQRQTQRQLAEERSQRREATRAELDRYRKEWLRTFGVDPGLSAAAKAFRERELARAGGSEALLERRRLEFEDRLRAQQKKESPEEKAAKRIQKIYRQHHGKVCENQPQLENKNPFQTIKLRVMDIKNVPHYICYDIIELVSYLRSIYSSPRQWKDPTFGTPYDNTQKRMIQDRFEKVSSCGKNTQVFSLTVYSSGTSEVLLPKAIYDRSLKQEHGRLIFRISNPQTRFLSDRENYGYLAATGFQDQYPEIIFVPDDFIAKLGLLEGQEIYLEECFELPAVSEIILQPESPEWYLIPIEATEEIKQALTEYIEKQDAIYLGQVLPVQYGDVIYNLYIVDLRGPNKTRIGAGSPKFVEVNLAFYPKSRK